MMALLMTLSAAFSIFGQELPGWHLKWADEFGGKAGSPPDPLKWKYDLGDGSPRNPGWGNNEKQQYTDSTENVFHDGNGHLVIQAVRAGKDSFTSGRIKTQELFDFQYGRIEAKIRIPYAYGLWPAFWMLGSSYKTTPWPVCGEVDIMENFGARNREFNVIHATVHGPGYASTGITGFNSLPSGRFDEDFHLFTAEWWPKRIEFFVDEKSFLVVTPAKMPSRGSWVFDDGPFFILLNLAVGGYPAPVGYPDANVPFPQKMLVDFVRVYQR
jgi:beta-glucanase (GH16 family)